jgi:hypothetical protein
MTNNSKVNRKNLIKKLNKKFKYVNLLRSNLNYPGKEIRDLHQRQNRKYSAFGSAELPSRYFL